MLGLVNTTAISKGDGYIILRVAGAYTAAAIVINGTLKRTVLPVVPLAQPA